DQSEYPKIRVSADLVEKPGLVFRQKIERPDARQALGHEWPREVQRFVAADQILDAPRHALGAIKSILVAVIVTHVLAPLIQARPVLALDDVREPCTHKNGRNAGPLDRNAGPV